MIPIHEMDRLVGLSGGNLHRHAVTQQLVGAQISLIERDSGGVRRCFQLLQGGGNVGVGIAAQLQVLPQQYRFDGAVVLALAPFAKVAVAEAIGTARIREQRDDAVLRSAFGARLLRHENPLVKRGGFSR